MTIRRTMGAANALPDVLPADPELAAQARDWLAHLACERRGFAPTATSYARDLRQFLRFAAAHFGEPASLATFAGLAPSDLRAFLAARRGLGAGRRAPLRQLAGLRPFAGYLERNGQGKA